jgi:hypothetical protein
MTTKPEPPSVYEVVGALAARTTIRAGRQTIPHASAQEVAQELAAFDIDLVRSSLKRAVGEGYVSKHPEYTDMYFVTDAGEGLLDAAAFQ